ncbi:MAG TPA: hypothetical protein EYP49_17165 [Anaerolineae bacterium]|nr:hypothetical protein [Anaerolineae bacterium]
MPVLKDIEIHISIDELLRAQGSAAQRPAVREAARWAAAEAQHLAEPAAVWDLLPVHGVDGERARVGEAWLYLGPHADLLAPARQALVSVATIGPALEAEARCLIQEGSLLEGFMLDSAGVLALAAVGDSLSRLAEALAAQRGWGVSLTLAPGSLMGWPVHDQKALCSLLDLSAIGVTLNPSQVLMPYKSASRLVGLGPGYTAKQVESACRFCPQRETCWRRH